MRYMRIVAAALGLSVSLAACSKFLDTPRAVADPNNPTAANINQLFVGVEANVFGQQEGPVAMIVCEWMQQCAGVNGRFVDQQGVFVVGKGLFDFFHDVRQIDLRTHDTDSPAVSLNAVCSVDSGACQPTMPPCAVSMASVAWWKTGK